MNDPVPTRLTRTAALTLAAVLSACGGNPQQQVQGQPDEARAMAQQGPPVQGPPPVAHCGAPEPDSTTIVSMALQAIQTPDLPLRVSSFVRHHEGVLVSLLPRRRDTVGGGGLVWVDRDGCLMVLKRYE